MASMRDLARRLVLRMTGPKVRTAATPQRSEMAALAAEAARLRARCRSTLDSTDVVRAARDERSRR
jgi:hypothetical protein